MRIVRRFRKGGSTRHLHVGNPFTRRHRYGRGGRSPRYGGRTGPVRR